MVPDHRDRRADKGKPRHRAVEDDVALLVDRSDEQLFGGSHAVLVDEAAQPLFFVDEGGSRVEEGGGGLAGGVAVGGEAPASPTFPFLFPFFSFLFPFFFGPVGPLRRCPRRCRRRLYRVGLDDDGRRGGGQAGEGPQVVARDDLAHRGLAGGHAPCFFVCGG